MATADALNKYFRRARRWFPFGFSKYFHISTSGERRRYKEIKAFDNEVIDDLLADVRQDALALQSENLNLTYRDLVDSFGSPRKLMKELIAENLPESEFAKLKTKQKRICLGVPAVALAILFIFSIHILTLQANVHVQEVKTLITEDDNVPSATEAIDITDFFHLSLNEEMP